jgi:rSAM/selenodomain-associated transferase 1
MGPDRRFAMADAPAIAIFAKAPVPGFAKTRLIPVLGAEGAAALAARLIRRIAAQAAASNLGEVTLWCAPDADHPLFGQLANRQGLRLATQQGADIGERMAHAFAATQGPLILVGADCPSIDTARLRQAARQLEEADIVIDPAEDGGYGLVAGSMLPSGLFQGIAWSTSRVMAQTRERAATLGLHLAQGPLLRDLDTPEDLAWWRSRAPDLFHDILL